MTEVKDNNFIINNYYIMLSGKMFMEYLGEYEYDGNNFIATHYLNDFGRVIEVESPYRTRMYHVTLYTDNNTEYLTEIKSKKFIRGEKIDELLSS